jgi:signal recognition particle subunit SRP54
MKTNGFNVVVVDSRSFGCRSRNDGWDCSLVPDAIKPQETLFVVDAMTGQDAVILQSLQWYIILME